MAEWLLSLKCKLLHITSLLAIRHIMNVRLYWQSSQLWYLRHSRSCDIAHAAVHIGRGQISNFPSAPSTLCRSKLLLKSAYIMRTPTSSLQHLTETYQKLTTLLKQTDPLSSLVQHYHGAIKRTNGGPLLQHGYSRIKRNKGHPKQLLENYEYKVG